MQVGLYFRKYLKRLSGILRVYEYSKLLQIYGIPDSNIRSEYTVYLSGYGIYTVTG